MGGALDKKVAEIIFGEPEPEQEWDHAPQGYEAWWWKKWMVYTDDRVYKPVPFFFSTSLGEAIRAADKYFRGGGPSSTPPKLLMEYHPRKVQQPQYSASYNGRYGWGYTLPEAIRKLLVALNEAGADPGGDDGGLPEPEYVY